MKKNSIVVVGYSGHGFTVAEAAIDQGLNLKYYTEREEVRYNPFNLKYLGFESGEDYNFWENDYQYILGIGDNILRQKVAALIWKRNGYLKNVVHPSSSISNSSRMGTGNFFSRNSAVNALVSLGNNCIINTGSIVEHECNLSDGVHIGPGAVLAGGVSVGENSFIGANATVKEGVKIGKNAIIGAGTVIIHNVGDSEKVVGNPGRLI